MYLINLHFIKKQTGGLLLIHACLRAGKQDQNIQISHLIPSKNFLKPHCKPANLLNAGLWKKREGKIFLRDATAIIPQENRGL